MLDLAGHGGYILIAVGMYLLATGRSIGWAWRLLGEVVWLGIGLAMDMSSMVIWGGIFIGIDAMGWFNATRRKKNEHARGV